MVSVFVDAFLKALMEVGFDSLQHCSVDLSDFHAYSVLQLVQCTGTMHIYTSLEVPPQKIITHGQVRGPRGPRSVSKPGNEVILEKRTKNGHRCSGCVSRRPILLKPHMLDGHVSSSQCRHKEAIYHLNIALGVHSNSISMIVFEKVRTDDGRFSQSTPDSHFWTV